MHKPAARVAWLATLTWPAWCRAEATGSFLNFSPGAEFGIAALLALPTAVVCIALEAIAPRRLVSWWLGVPAGLAAVVGIVVILLGGADSAFYWFVVPPLAVLALRAMLWDPMWRLVAGWIVASTAVIVAVAKNHNPDYFAIVLGGAASCMICWSSIVLMFLARDIVPTPERVHTRRLELHAAIAVIAPVADKVRSAAAAVFSRIERVLTPAQTGLYWWLGATAVFYFGIGAALMIGKDTAAMSVYSELQQVIDLLGLRVPRAMALKQVWWFVGLPWSLIAASAVWGLAGTFGAFDPGRARLARLAGLIFGGALLIWSALMFAHMRETEAAEQQAVGVRG